MIVWSLCLIIYLSYSIFFFASPVKHLCRPDQRDDLWEFKNEFYVQRLNFHWWKSDTKTEKWRKNTDCCSWDGVSCELKTGMVIKLDLKDSFLNGPLRSNSSLLRLRYLQSLSLDSNNLSGTLPNSISNLKYLRVLSLPGCNLFGKIPSSLGNLSYLTNLDPFENGFTGELPGSMGNLRRLTDLQLGFNNLNGNFPVMLFNLSELTRIIFRSNHFEGILPSNLSSLTKLVNFDMSENSFSGPVPSSIFMMPSLIHLALVRNDFSGPLEIGNIPSPSQLRELSLGENNFSGPISRSIFKLVGLRSLDLSYWNTCKDISTNQIRGQVPEWLWKLPVLRYVNISQNSFSSFEGPPHVIQRSEKYMLDISSNTFRDFPLLPNSTIFFLGSNNLFLGEIPRKICDMVSLDTLVLSQNNFNGSIPQCFENFNTTLSVLHLQNTAFRPFGPFFDFERFTISLRNHLRYDAAGLMGPSFPYGELTRRNRVRPRAIWLDGTKVALGRGGLEGTKLVLGRAGLVEPSFP
ncbi:hypothetical protein N665_1114s0003 [Sinapis alba]|nr:hypothetical protein N665_1114s0003 [Sinapis alba]